MSRSFPEIVEGTSFSPATFKSGKFRTICTPYSFVDGFTIQKLTQKHVELNKELANNNSYYALDMCDGLIKTGPTGTNVNDISVLLIKNNK